METMAWLVLSDDASQRWLLNKAEIIIGRRTPADVILAFPQISRQHARIEARPLGYFLTDLGSRNGTFVNGTSLAANTAHRLVGGDEIVFGGTLSFRFEDPDETTHAPALGRLQGVWINPETHAVWVDANPVEPPLSEAQFVLLNLLYRAQGSIVARDEIIAAVWHDVDVAGVSEEAVDGLIKRLRKKLRQNPSAPDYLQVIRGRGLRLIQPE